MDHDIWEAVIVTGLKPASWTYAEEFVTEDEVLTAARARAAEVGVSPIGNGGGAALRFLAAVTEARAVVEIGTGTGVSGVWMLRGMRPDGVLTTSTPRPSTSGSRSRRSTRPASRPSGCG